jgi:hypothetical protein
MGRSGILFGTAEGPTSHDKKYQTEHRYRVALARHCADYWFWRSEIRRAHFFFGGGVLHRLEIRFPLSFNDPADTAKVSH